MHLSKNLTLREVTKSNEAQRLGIDNTPTLEHVIKLTQIALRIFQPIRTHFDEPIYVSSGYRSPELNKAIGGSPSSQHSKGEALDLDADFYGKSLDNRSIFHYIRQNLEFDQLIWEFGNSTNPDWVHVSYTETGENRGQVLVAYKEEGKTKYKNYYE